MTSRNVRRRRQLAVVAAIPLLLAGLPLTVGCEFERADASVAPLGATEPDELVSVVLPDQDDVLDLIAAGADVTEYAKRVADGIEVHVVASEAERVRLRGLGFAIGPTIVSAEQVDAVVAERNASLQELVAVSALETDTLTVLRSEWFESLGGETYLSVEVRSSAGADAETVLTVAWDGNSFTMDRFVDAGEYLHHRFEQPVPVEQIPDEITITSSMGGTATAGTVQWLGEPRKADGPHYATGFVDHYMDPTEVYDRIEALAAEFPELAEIVALPYETNGYRRHAQALIGTTAGNRFYVTSHAWGHEGGNDLRLETRDPGVPDRPLGVAVEGRTIAVSLATNGSGALTSTAAQVVAAINASAEASALVRASRAAAGNGIAIADGEPLSDFLGAPESVSREPFRVRAIRIGRHRDGSRIGVFAYAQEHAREWVTPLVAVETAERLLRNYRNDAATKKLVDGLDIFIVPSVNPDGAHYSIYDHPLQRKNMTNHCGSASSHPSTRDAWGVDLNRNFSVGSLFDGYFGASATCTSELFAGPAELSEPESRNEIWLTEQFPNIRFAMNVHSYGGYFMWPPGAYVEDGRVSLPRPTFGEESYYWAASGHILSAVQSWRGTAVWPSRTGPVSDVLYSAAGNSTDEHWYDRGVIGWVFEVGVDRWNPETADWEIVGFQPPFAEGFEEAMEFASGLTGLFEVARAYGSDVEPPKSRLTVADGAITFAATEPVTIHYTLDGSRPTWASPMVSSAGIRDGAAPVPVPPDTTVVRWFSVDAAGNVEARYDPLGKAENDRQAVVTIH